MTGLCTRAAAAERINAALRCAHTGALLALDIDGLSRINRTLGHQVGDRLICEAARVVGTQFFPREIVGRTGGDVFVIFLHENCSRRCIDERGEQLCRRLQETGRQIGGVSALSVTLGYSFARAGDSFDTLYDRALQEVSSIRASRCGRGGVPGGAAGTRGVRLSGICTDMEIIRQDLREQTLSPGAYCQDYAAFQRIYRFVERGLARSGTSAYVILITLTDGRGDFMDLEFREEAMDRLQHVIRYSLRSGDVFTCYSSCQYLLMVLGATGQNALDIGQRIQHTFLQEMACGRDVELVYDVYPLQAIGS